MLVAPVLEGKVTFEKLGVNWEGGVRTRRLTVSERKGKKKKNFKINSKTLIQVGKI